MSLRLRIDIAFSTLAFLLIAAIAGAGQTTAWHSLISNNFTFIGNASELDLRSEAARLETFRNAFGQLYPNLKLGNGKPTTVILFNDATAFEAVLPKRADGAADNGVTGYFLAGEKQNYIGLALDQKHQPARSPIIHEFVHLVLESNFEAASLPPWLNEGLAEYFDATELKGTALFIGDENRNHLRLLRRVGLVPISDVVSVTTEHLRSMPLDRRQQFYAESWLLVRQLIADRKLQIDDLSAQLGKLKIGDPLSALFSVDPIALQAALTKTVADRSPKFATLKVAAAIEPLAAAAAMAPARSSAILGELLFQMGETDRAETYLKDALAADKNEPLANAVYGKILVARNKLAEAKPFLKRAIDSGSTDHWVYYDYAFAISREFISDGMIGDISDTAASELLYALRRSIELEPNFIESYRLAARIELARDENLEEAVTFARRALAIKPDDADLKLVLARILLRRDDAVAARQLANEVAASSDITKTTEAGEIIKTADEITGSRSSTNTQNQLALSVARAQPIAVLKRSWLTDTDLAQIETDRINNNFNRLIIRARSGEQQAVGRIQRVVCSGSDISYYVTTGKESLILKSPDFNSVQMTVAQEAGNSYSLGCGAKLEKALTVINFQPSATGRGVITAISFVPDDFRLKSLREMMAARMVAIDDDTLRRGISPVWVNAESARRSIQNDLRKPGKDETRLLGQIEKIECTGNNWVMQVVSDGKRLRFGPPQHGEPALGWFTVPSTQLSLECDSSAIPGTAIFTFAKADALDGELHAIEFVPDGFTLSASGR